MQNKDLELPTEDTDKLMQGGNEHEEMEPSMNGGKRTRKMRKSKKAKKMKKKGPSMKKKGLTMKKKGGALTKSLNGLAAVGALFGAQQLYARKNKSAVKKTMKKKSFRKSKK